MADGIPLKKPNPPNVSPKAIVEGADSGHSEHAASVVASWHTRGYVPHFESPVRVQHVTFHLADSLAKEALILLEEELERLPADKQAAARRTEIASWLDAGYGSCVLAEPEVGSMVQESLLFFDGHRYELFAWVVMPNHVHVLFQPTQGWTVAKIVASWKKFTARNICDFRRLPWNAVVGEPEEVWHREYWDRFIRDERHFGNVVEYICQNPVKAGLVDSPEKWRWSSAFAEVKSETDSQGI